MPTMETPPPSPPLTTTEVTTSEAAAITKLSQRAITAAIAAGRLTPVRKLPGRTGAYLLDLDEVRRYGELTSPRPRQKAPAND